MKLAVILGVLQMCFGIFLKATNAIHFRKKVDFFFEFIPQIIFMTVLFVYMDFLILFKWCKNWAYINYQAPSIITTLINIAINIGKTTEEKSGGPMWGTYESTSQNSIQFLILSSYFLISYNRGINSCNASSKTFDLKI